MDEAFLKALLEKWVRFRDWLRVPGRAQRFFPLLLLGLALLYYGSYLRHDLRFRDEGGTVALNAQRLLNGERPLLDVTLNYNVVWYYPVVWLFKWCGVNFVLMRGYFLALSTVAALLAFFTVTRAGRQPWMGFWVALLCVLVPGMMFKNYIPLLVIANSLLLLRAALTTPGSGHSYREVALGGLLVGATFLIRIDLGIFFTALWLGLHLLRLLDGAVSWRAKGVAAAAGLALTVGLAWLVHQPVLWDARQRGFEDRFTAQYLSWVKLIDSNLRTRIGLAERPPDVKRKRPPRTTEASVFWNRNELGRNDWQEFLEAKDFDTRALVILTYLPAVTIAGLLAATLLGLARGLRAPEPEAWRRPLAALVVLGGSLTAFPQFFFIRPDAPHLSEFAPGYWVGAVSAAFLLGASPGSWRATRWPGRIFFCAILAHAGLYLFRMMPDRWTGTIAARRFHDTPFRAANGVDVYVSSSERPALEALCNVVAEHSKPGDYLVAYPYHPMINVMTNRRTYEKDVYIDNATRTLRWDEEAIARFERFQPAVIVLSDWAINGHEDSRFSVWARPTKDWVQAHYDFQGVYKTNVDAFEVFTRRQGTIEKRHRVHLRGNNSLTNFAPHCDTGCSELDDVFPINFANPSSFPLNEFFE